MRGSVHDRLRLLIRRRTCSTGLNGTVSFVVTGSEFDWENKEGNIRLAVLCRDVCLLTYLLPSWSLSTSS